MAGTAAGGFAVDLRTLLLARAIAGAFGGPATSLSFSIISDAIPAQVRGRPSSRRKPRAPRPTEGLPATQPRLPLLDPLTGLQLCSSSTSVYGDSAALRESMPPAVAALGPLGRAIGRKATWDLLKKYGAEGVTEPEAVARLRSALVELRGALAGQEWLLGEFSYADVTGAMALGFVSPHARAPLGPASRPLWTVEALASEFADLVAWRDRVVDEARRRRDGDSAGAD